MKKKTQSSSQTGFQAAEQIGSSAILPVKLKQFVGVVQQSWLAFQEGFRV
jgi:hypothetical protein